VICWSCQRPAGSGEKCGSCGALQPPQLGADHFQVLGLPRRFEIDVKAAEGRFRALSREVHPDRFATADPRARKFALQRTVQLNEAWKTVKDPVRRAEYLLSLEGWEVGAESGASRPASGGTRERLPVPPALLGEVLELREELAEARADGDDARVQKLARDVRQRADEAMAQVASGFASAETAADRGKALEPVAHQLIGIRYWRRFLDEVAAHDEARDQGEEAARNAAAEGGAKDDSPEALKGSARA
jgi:molecular chaperone HscB